MKPRGTFIFRKQGPLIPPDLAGELTLNANLVVSFIRSKGGKTTSNRSGSTNTRSGSGVEIDIFKQLMTLKKIVWWRGRGDQGIRGAVTAIRHFLI